MTTRTCEIFICVGAGGVGKTTIACVLGLVQALQGNKVLVITVDPARRLSDTLSLKNKSALPVFVDVKSLINQEVNGELFALMPDLKKEWQDFLKIAIKNADVRRDILHNHFYQYMADGLPGSFEIICSHVLFKLMKSGQYDKIILDTPPSSHSLSFFDVPKKISNVLEQNIFRTLVKSRHSLLFKITKKLAFFSGSVLEKSIERLIGSHFFSEVIDFALTIDGLYEPMLERVRAMDRILKSPHSHYVLVARPTRASIEDSLNLCASLKKRGIKIDQIVFNQLLPFLSAAAEKEHAAFKMAFDKQEVVTVLDEWMSLYQAELALEEQLVVKLKKSFPEIPYRKLFFSDDKMAKNHLLAFLLKNYCEQKS